MVNPLKPSEVDTPKQGTISQKLRVLNKYKIQLVQYKSLIPGVLND
jgi:hypothetical protein